MQLVFGVPDCGCGSSIGIFRRVVKNEMQTRTRSLAWIHDVKANSTRSVEPEAPKTDDSSLLQTLSPFRLYGRMVCQSGGQSGVQVAKGESMALLWHTVASSASLWSLAYMERSSRCRLKTGASLHAPFLRSANGVIRVTCQGARGVVQPMAHPLHRPRSPRRVDR